MLNCSTASRAACQPCTRSRCSQQIVAQCWSTSQSFACQSTRQRRSLSSFTNRISLCRDRRQRVITCLAPEGELVPDVEPGTKVKVTEEITVFHAPKLKEGLQLKGMEGEVLQIVKKFQGKELSANLPYKVQFIIPKDEGKDVKFTAHLDASEFESA